MEGEIKIDKLTIVFAYESAIDLSNALLEDVNEAWERKKGSLYKVEY